MNGYPAPKEKQGITDHILAYLNGLDGCYAIKIHGGPYQRRGTPDVHATYGGRSLWIEVKRAGRHPEAIQAHELAKWAEAGAVAGVARSVDDVRELLRRAHLDA